MIETIEGLKPILLPVAGGIDEESPVDGTLIEDAVKMTNWRLSKDGKRIQKRGGLAEEATAFAEDVYGYATYVNSGGSFCQIAVLESQVQRKVGSGGWANIKTWGTGIIIDHVVKPLEIQGKQFIITEKGSCVIQADGGVRQIGITAPATIPTLSTAYVSGAGASLTESWYTYADQAAMDVVWPDADGAAGVSTLETSDPYSTPGPQADTHYAKFVTGVGGVLNSAKRYRILTTDIGSVYSVDFATYFKLLNYYHSSSIAASQAGFMISVYNGIFLFKVHIARDGVYFYGNNNIPVRIGTDAVPLEKWIVWNVHVEGSDPKAVKVTVYQTIAGIMKTAGEITYYNPDASSQNYIVIELKNLLGTDNQEAWLDYLNITSLNTETAVIAGMYRYAISFVRTGDFGCESNAIRSKFGTVTFTGTHLNDMTLDTTDSEYTGQTTKTIRVKVKSVAAQDIIQWSSDGGSTWSAELGMGLKMYLGDGVYVNFAAITGHTAGEYWEIPCNAISVIATMQQVTLASIPTSSDAQVNARKIYRTTAGGATFFYLTTIYDNTTATFVDNFPDYLLGDELEVDRDLFSDASTTVGKFFEWWDDRLWVADHAENMVYYSAVRTGGGVPEEFSVDTRFIPIRKGSQGDVITAMKAYKDGLYVFKRNDIFIIQQTALGYGVYHINSDVGCIADGAVEEANDFLTFPSEKGPEIYNGVKTFGPEFAVSVNKTWAAIDPTGYKYISVVHNKQFNEVWYSLPSSATTLVWNYIKNKFYYFDFYKTPSCLVTCKDSTGKKVVKMGTRDGYLDLCESGYADNTTPITATYRKGWIDMEAHGIVRLLKVKFELPASMTITTNVYVDMDKDVFRTASLTGSTPASTDINLRRVIGDKAELGTRSRWLAVEFTNAQNCGGDCKINEVYLFVRPDVIKKKVTGD